MDHKYNGTQKWSEEKKAVNVVLTVETMASSIQFQVRHPNFEGMLRLMMNIFLNCDSKNESPEQSGCAPVVSAMWLLIATHQVNHSTRLKLWSISHLLCDNRFFFLLTTNRYPAIISMFIMQRSCSHHLYRISAEFMIWPSLYMHIHHPSNHQLDTAFSSIHQLHKTKVLEGSWFVNELANDACFIWEVDSSQFIKLM